MGLEQGWALCMERPWEWRGPRNGWAGREGPHGHSELMGPGQGGALGIDEPLAWMAPMGPRD